jgi:hypothetical protein
VKNKKGYREIKPGKKSVKKVYLWIMLWFVGRAIQAAAKVDRDVRNEFAKFPEDFTVSLGILPDGPCMIVGKDKNDKVQYMGGKPEGKDIDLSMQIKNLEAALLLFTFQESTCLAISRDRIVVAGDLRAACAFVRILNIVETYLLPKFLARLVVKRYQSPPSKHINRFRIYFRTILGY